MARQSVFWLWRQGVHQVGQLSRASARWGRARLWESDERAYAEYEAARLNQMELERLRRGGRW